MLYVVNNIHKKTNLCKILTYPLCETGKNSEKSLTIFSM